MLSYVQTFLLSKVVNLYALWEILDVLSELNNITIIAVTFKCVVRFQGSKWSLRKVIVCKKTSTKIESRVYHEYSACSKYVFTIDYNQHFHIDYN